MSARTTAVALLVVAATALGCSGERATIKADTAEFPVSLSDGLRNPDGSLVGDAQKRSVGRFEVSFRDWTGLWSLIPWRYTHDISKDVDAQVARAGGNAIVDLSVQANHCFWSYLTLLGILPDCGTIDVVGNILHVDVPPAPALPEAGTAAPAAPAR